jgi:hypothetical protein
LKAGEPTRYPDTSAGEVIWSAGVHSPVALVEKCTRGEEVREKSASLDNRARHETTLCGRHQHGGREP